MLIRAESDQRERKQTEAAPIAPEEHRETPGEAVAALVDGAVRDLATADRDRRDLIAAEDVLDELGTYDAMFRDYLHHNRHWIGPVQQPLVFHIRKLCRRLDADEDAPASFASAYLQAISRLDKMRPGAPQPQRGELPGQGSIFDELDD